MPNNTPTTRPAELGKFHADIWPVGAVVTYIAIGAGSHEFDSRDGQIGQSWQRLPTAEMFLQSCVAQQARNRGDGPRHS